MTSKKPKAKPRKPAKKASRMLRAEREIKRIASDLRGLTVQLAEWRRLADLKIEGHGERVKKTEGYANLALRKFASLEALDERLDGKLLPSEAMAEVNRCRATIQEGWSKVDMQVAGLNGRVSMIEESLRLNTRSISAPAPATVTISLQGSKQ